MDQDTNLIGAFNEKQFVISETGLVDFRRDKMQNIINRQICGKDVNSK